MIVFHLMFILFNYKKLKCFSTKASNNGNGKETIIWWGFKVILLSDNIPEFDNFEKICRISYHFSVQNENKCEFFFILGIIK